MKDSKRDSDYIAFVDECGDHSLTKIDRDFPVFVLSLVLTRRQEYWDLILPAFDRLKLDYWDHEGINLHSRDIRKAQGDFVMLHNASVRTRFMSDLAALLSALPYVLLIVGIRKDQLCDQYERADNPYELALRFAMERVLFCVEREDQTALPVIAESRGNNEDNALKATFYDLVNNGTRFIAGDRFRQRQFPIQFRDKRNNIAGLQLADLCAHPASRHILKPEQPNRAFEIAREHLFANNGVVEGWGWKVFP